MACDITGFTWTGPGKVEFVWRKIKGLVEFNEEAFSDPAWALQELKDQPRKLERVGNDQPTRG